MVSDQSSTLTLTQAEGAAEPAAEGAEPKAEAEPLP